MAKKFLTQELDVMNFTINDVYGEKFKAALKESGEDEQVVLERIIKMYIYEVFSRKQEKFFALETFMKLPDPEK